MELVLDDQIGWRQSLGCGDDPAPVRAPVSSVGREEPANRALAVDTPEQRLDFTLPRHLRELVDGGDYEARALAVDLLVDDDHRQPLFVRCAREVAAIAW